MTISGLSRTNIRVPVRSRLTLIHKCRLILAGTFLSPIYWALAYRYSTPGLDFRLECTRLAFRLILRRLTPYPFSRIYVYLFGPMDSTRYFEFDFMWRAMAELPIEHYLDVSSPRLFPVILIEKHPDAIADFINPDTNDIAATGQLVRALGLESRCQLHDCLITQAPFENNSFDVITSISVLEHIPEDRQAVQKMWDLLKPGGRLLLTVPCAVEASEQYIDRNEYGLLTSDEEGFTFWQRFYNQELLYKHIFTVTGQPRQMIVYGEKVKGTFFRNAERKRADPLYPMWREPYMMGKEYGCFQTITDLPGEGVVAMEFVKP